ncbi:MAG TPA: PLP-dependent aminotransferase family protein [Polyangia bacterium]|jgi:DNA-binding transcriptional MocR family regulator|nr:PLP-dependent aminotransferase family protein [Polyangia bacterium]
MSGGATHLYESVASRFAEAINVGSLKVGDRLPSVRRVSIQQRVSIATAVQAYRHLENQRLIEARPKSGYFVLSRPTALAEPATSKPPATARFVGVNQLVMEVLEAGRISGVVPLGSACPSPEMFPGEKLLRLAHTEGRRKHHLMAAYPMSPGYEKLRTMIARRSVDFGCRLSQQEIIVTNGCIEALNLALRAVAKPGDTIALESPTYFTLLQIIESLGMKALEIPTHPRDGLSIDALDLATQRPGVVKAVIVIPNFQNPLGTLMPDENKARLVQLCEARDIALIEDDIYGDIHFGASRPRVAKAWDRSDRVILCSSFTKTLAPGFRVGWIAPGRLFQQVAMLKFISSVATPELPQAAIAEFLADGGYDHHLRRLRAGFGRQVQQTSRTIARYFPEGTKITRPAGGFVLWVELPAAIDALELFRRARDERISVAPGPMFTTTKRFRNCLRIGCGHPSSPKIEAGLRRLATLAHALA